MCIVVCLMTTIHSFLCMRETQMFPTRVWPNGKLRDYQPCTNVGMRAQNILSCGCKYVFVHIRSILKRRNLDIPQDCIEDLV